jgi:GNAT superfamily N-acetyltransferase
VKPKIVPLDASQHERGAFSCGKAAVDRYLQGTAVQAVRYFKAGTFVLCTDDEPCRVLGFYTLLQHEYRDPELDEITARALRVQHLNRIPMILLGQLGVLEEFQGQGFGKKLLWNALYRSYATAASIGGVAIIADPIDDDARSFYAKFDFAVLHEQPFCRMLLPMRTLQRAIRGIGPLSVAIHNAARSEKSSEIDALRDAEMARKAGDAKIKPFTESITE